MQGRSPTCYSPVRHSSTPKGLSVRLACVKHAASVRPEPESNSPNKNPQTQRSRQNPNQKNLTKPPEKSGIKKPHPNTGVSEHGKKQKQQTKTTKHTIEFSNNTPACVRSQGNPTSLLQRVILGQIGLPSRSAGPGHCQDVTPSVPVLFPRPNSASSPRTAGSRDRCGKRRGPRSLRPRPGRPGPAPPRP